VYMDRFLAGRGLSPVTLAGAQLLAATGLTAIALPLVHGWAIRAWRVDAILALLCLGLLSTGIAYVLNYRIITDDGASAASLVSYLLPIVAVILGVVVLREDPTAHALIGMVITLAGVVMARHAVSAGSTTRPVRSG
jgi:drug/metabolite transporter (DMT)-like permease